jgi:hypothetical protein
MNYYVEVFYLSSMVKVSQSCCEISYHKLYHSKKTIVKLLESLNFVSVSISRLGTKRLTSTLYDIIYYYRRRQCFNCSEMLKNIQKYQLYHSSSFQILHQWKMNGIYRYRLEYQIPFCVIKVIRFIISAVRNFYVSI